MTTERTTCPCCGGPAGSVGASALPGALRYPCIDCILQGAEAVVDLPANVVPFIARRAAARVAAEA